MSDQNSTCYIDQLEKEIAKWRTWYLDKMFVKDAQARNILLNIPSEKFNEKSPEENLIMCLSTALNIID